jgi:hypothetical protein
MLENGRSFLFCGRIGLAEFDFREPITPGRLSESTTSTEECRVRPNRNNDHNKVIIRSILDNDDVFGFEKNDHPRANAAARTARGPRMARETGWL